MNFKRTQLNCILQSIVILLSCCFVVLPCKATTPLRVGVIMNTPPFISYHNDLYTGLAIDIWKNIATTEHIDFVYVPIIKTIDQALLDVANQKIDILLGPIGTSYDRFKIVDFTRPYFLNQIGVIEYKKKPQLFQIIFIFGDILSSPFILGFIIYFIIYVHLLWLFESKTNPEIPKTYGEGLSYVLWLHLQLRRNWNLPRTISARIAAFSWLLTAGLLVTSITAAVTSKLTVALALHAGHFTNPSSLKNVRVAVIQSTLAESEARRIGAKVEVAPNIDQAVAWLLQNKVHAIVISYITGKTYINTHEYTQLQLAKFIIANDEYAFALRKHDPLRQKIDSALLFLQGNGYMKLICANHIGNTDAKACVM